MNTPIDDGGQAFPCLDSGGLGTLQLHDPGMSLRDYIAIAAMSGSLGGVPGPHLVRHTLASDSYALADEMLKARKAPQ